MAKRFAAHAMAVCVWVAAGAPQALAQTRAPTMGAKLQPYIGCINRLSERAHESKARYLSWAKPSGPTGRERIIYGTYTIYDTADCRKAVVDAAGAEPRNADVEKAGADYAAAVGALEPLLKEADDYYSQSNYKDDKMALGKALHPKLMAAWAAFERADKDLRGVVGRLNDQAQMDQIADVERTEGRKARFHVMDAMLKAKMLSRIESVEPQKMDVPKVVEALAAYEAAVKALERYAGENPGDKVDSSFVSAAKGFLASAKDLMRRARDKVPYSAGDRMMLSQQGAGWMVEGSPQRLTRDYNALVERYNASSRF